MKVDPVKHRQDVVKPIRPFFDHVQPQIDFCVGPEHVGDWKRRKTIRNSRVKCTWSLIVMSVFRIMRNHKPRSYPNSAFRYPVNLSLMMLAGKNLSIRGRLRGMGQLMWV